MKKTFVCNDGMIITIPIGNIGESGQLMPDKFHCVFKDSYKIFVLKGKPKPLGAAQAIGGVFLSTLGLILSDSKTLIYTLPSILFVITGLLSFAAGRGPHMAVAKLSFSLNIISFFWSVAAVTLCICLDNLIAADKLMVGINGLIIVMLLIENLMSLFLIFWISKAICRQHFNTLPIILLKQGD